MRKSLCVGTFTVGILCATAALALAQSAASPNANPSNELSSAIQSWILTAAGALVSLVIAYISKLLSDRFGIALENSRRDALQTATTNAAGLILNSLGNQLQGTKLAQANVSAEAVKYVSTSVPDAVKQFGLTDERIREIILAKVPQIANTTPAPASKVSQAAM